MMFDGSTMRSRRSLRVLVLYWGSTILTAKSPKARRHSVGTVGEHPAKVQRRTTVSPERRQTVASEVNP